MRTTVLLAGALMIMATATESQAAPATCKVPKIETCQGCLKKVNVTPLPSGTCRVTFDVSPQALIPGSPGDVTIEMDVAGAAPVARSHRRAAAPRWKPRRQAARRVARAYRAMPADNCFRFNGSTICE